jgi:pyroglutamyl-peptidase
VSEQRLLLTGFEPFAGATVNPSAEVVRLLAERGFSAGPRVRLHTAILPVVAEKIPAVLTGLLNEYQPDWVVSLGEARGRTAINLERIGVNLLDFGTPDNQGVLLQDTPIVPHGPAAYWSNLPLRAMQTAMQAQGVPAVLSLSAGAYICNQVLYTSLHWAAEHRPACQVGFFHLPSLPEQVFTERRPRASMALETLLGGVEAALACL